MLIYLFTTIVFINFVRKSIILRPNTPKNSKFRLIERCIRTAQKQNRHVSNRHCRRHGIRKVNRSP